MIARRSRLKSWLSSLVSFTIASKCQCRAGDRYIAYLMSRRIEPISRDKNSCFSCFGGILRSYDYPMMAFDAGSSDDFLSLASQECLHAALIEFMDRKKLQLSGLCVRAVFSHYSAGIR